MNVVSEETSSIAHANTDSLRQPRPLRWQIFQGLLYLVGSLSFTGGSLMYFTGVFRSHPNAFTLGGWLFTIGSAIFLLADLQDWWDYRTGYCFSYTDHRMEDISLLSFNTNTSSNRDNHPPIELNVYGSMCGIAFYLAGSILFIPVFVNYLTVGEWFFIFGSTFSYSSLIWKMYRSACQNFDQKFHLRTLFRDIPLLALDLLSTIGNICFFIGTILFLPQINRSDGRENRAAFLFVLGSGCFVSSSLVLQYIICCSPR